MADQPLRKREVESQVLLVENVQKWYKMKNKEQIQHEVDKTLDSLEGIQQASVNPYLFTKIKAALKKEEKNVWSRALSFISRPSVAFATIIIAIFINAILFFEFRSSQHPQSSREGEQVFASDYNLADNTIYDSTVEPE